MSELKSDELIKTIYRTDQLEKNVEMMKDKITDMSLDMVRHKAELEFMTKKESRISSSISSIIIAVTVAAVSALFSMVFMK